MIPYNYIRARRSLAHYHAKKKPNFSEISRKYGVSRKKLSRRWNNLPSRSTRPPTNRVLSLDQEKAIFLWLEYLDNMGASPTSDQIEASANYLLGKDFTGLGEPPHVGKMWTYDFQKRLPAKYVQIIQWPQEKERTAAEHYGEFIDLQIAIKEYKIRPCNLWNFDETGFIVGHEITFEWLQHFQHFTKPEWPWHWRLLLIDNHTTHLTMQFRIRPFQFPAHSTHFLQPLNGVPFQQYKHIHGRVVNKVARLGGFDFDQNNFFKELHDIRLKTFTQQTIRNSWRERGIWPINPDLILSQMPSPEEAFEALAAEGDTLKIYGEADDTIPSSPTIKSISPPSTTAKLRRYVNKIEKSIDSIKDILNEASPGLSRRIKTINKGSLTIAKLGDLHRENFTRIQDIAARKNKKSTRHQVKAFGALYVKDANRLIKRRHDGDLLKIHKRHALGEEEPVETEAPTERQNLGFFIDTQGNR
ncbi:hypothetical protein DPV78_001460 [Talaromyces pinophilus]|nr:hypothetical protein DPV78_001460 [Talaromyces pinophilus]